MVVDDVSRLVLNRVCQDAVVPYVDVATDVPEDPQDHGGRMFFSATSGGCVVCADLLDPKSIRGATESSIAAQERASLYGVPTTALTGQGPSVVSLNGIVASLAVNEIMVFLTGLRRSQRLLTYRGRTGVVTTDPHAGRPGCPECSPSVRGRNDHSAVSHWIAEIM